MSVNLRWLVLLGVMVIACATPDEQVAVEVRDQCLGGKASLVLPKDFGPMTNEVMEKKYWGRERPQDAFSNESGTISIVLNHTVNVLPEQWQDEFLDAYVAQFNQAYPSIEWVDKGVVETGAESWVKLEFITPAVDTKIYNIMRIDRLETRMLVTAVNMPVADSKKWRDIGLEMLKSLRF